MVELFNLAALFGRRIMTIKVLIPWIGHIPRFVKSVELSTDRIECTGGIQIR